ncbi:DNA-directed RNA polymerase beta' subunit [Candidatus Babela massiliensis]|uniref:DNA-directed RNA polymerase subunit beta' n=1 Tax=Candidatus Babela massiliensis TaxID=673862 RepID=V6DG60_9BACT|nr:DNA-directed RNA polymerase subunit beta' [Candidatus Babela massiliensis]CDK30539.1 DNA-directed RNA polymerase beta' subunit [Candidatus Babela massiliensis]
MSNRLLERFREYINTTQFNSIKIGLASPEKIRSLSYGEVKKIETINYRTLKPERDGLFCARIFGPVKDWECNCGKYKRMKHRGITCEKCGVEVIQSRVRRERMGHIELVAPVSHIWYLKGIPSYLSLIMDMSIKDLERVIYFDAYLVIKQGRSPYPVKTLLSSVDYENYLDIRPDDHDFVAETGAKAIKDALSDMDLHDVVKALQIEYEKTTSVAVRHKMMRRIKVFSNLIQGNLRPEWMILSVLPVLPPDLRPLVPLEGGRFASSDLNELYRRVINRNIRLQRLIEIEAPSVIIKNEKRMLQESVDALIDNGRRGQPVRGPNRRQLKSLSEMLRGKQGRFRQNLLGKRVDYSGRSVIVVDPELKIDQCGLPKIMALELFKSHVYAGLLEREYAPNLRVAKRMVEESDPEVWDVLEEIVKGYPVLLNRAPTLHRLGIQAFYPILVDGKAIKVHPLVCSAFNADFDGDQMAVHIPLSKNAKEECKNLILSSKSVLSAANGRPVSVPSQDMVLGLYYITKVRFNSKGENIVFSNILEIISAYQLGQVDLHARIKLRLNSKDIVETTVGRVLLYDALPEGSELNWVNKVMTKGDLGKLLERVYYRFGPEETVKCLDKIKKLGFYNSTMAGVSFAIHNLIVPDNKDTIVSKAEKEVQKVEQLYKDGVITNGERYNKVISIWNQANIDVASQMTKEMVAQDKEAYLNEDKQFKPFNSIYMMLESGAKGTKDQVKQLSGMRGLMAKPSGEIMETPVKNNFKHGLSVFEYFISTHGARKGQADTALKTANSGYLTRRLVDVAQDVVVSMQDCKTLGYVELEDLKEAGDVLYSLSQRSYGRVVAQDIKDPITGEIILKQGETVGRDDIAKINDSAVSKILVRSPLVCQAKRGICALCYGYDLSKAEIADVGATVGIIAAQSIGEPGTQLTMRTFHVGGTANVSEQSYYVAKYDGTVKLRNLRAIENKDGQTIVLSRKAKLVILADDGRELQRNELEYGSILLVQDGQKVKVGTRLAEWDVNSKVILTERTGRIKFIDLIENVTIQERFDEATNKSSKFILEHKGDRYQPAIAIESDQGEELALYYLPVNAYLMVNNRQKVNVGDILVKTPREASRTKDITGGLPKIAELFEARMPKEPAILADIDGEIAFGGLQSGRRKISIINADESHDYFIPRSKQLNVANGDKVNAGDKLTTGTPVLHDILKILGSEYLQKYLLDQIQEIYRLQGIDINDRHIELIVRQMLRKVRVVDPGDTDFLIGDRVDKIHFKTVNEALITEGKKPAIGKPILMGITLSSLGTESFISSASFQETTRILAEAAISGQVDHLYGLKENVIIGKLIPAGTGIKSFRKKYLEKDNQLQY